jgi:hypothetical protein
MVVIYSMFFFNTVFWQFYFFSEREKSPEDGKYKKWLFLNLIHQLIIRIYVSFSYCALKVHLYMYERCIFFHLAF